MDLVFNALKEKELISDKTINSMKSWQHSGFSVFASKKIESEDENARLFLARYLKKHPISEKKLSIDESGIEPLVRYRNIDSGREVSFSPLQFLAELSLHIPKVFEQTTRMFGVYSSSTRGKIKREKRFKKILDNPLEPLPLPEKENSTPSPTFARLMKLVFEIDPLECPKCGENMKIVAFIQNYKEIEKIAQNLKYTTWCAPPEFKKSSFDSYDFEQI